MKPGPSLEGVQSLMFAPFPQYTAANRGAAVVALDWADIAGTIASRNGSANVAPMPRMNVRRGNAILVITIDTSPALVRAVPRHPHLKRRARDDTLDERAK